MAATASVLESQPLDRRPGHYIRDLWRRREFAWFLAMGNLRAQNATTTLGIFWYVLNPLLLSGVYFIVFGLIFAGGRRSPEFLAYLVSGMFVFHFTARTMTGGAATILNNAKLMVNLRFPRLLLPIASLIESSVGYLVSIVAFLALILPIAGTYPGWAILWFFPIFLIQIVMNLGLSALTARLAVPYRDVGNLLPFITRLWLYLSPIIWTVDLLEGAPRWVVDLVHLNPMFYLLRVYRAALIGSEFSASDIALAAGFALAAAVIGIAAFVRFEGRLVQHL